MVTHHNCLSTIQHSRQTQDGEGEIKAAGLFTQCYKLYLQCPIKMLVRRYLLEFSDNTHTLGVCRTGRKTTGRPSLRGWRPCLLSLTKGFPMKTTVFPTLPLPPRLPSATKTTHQSSCPLLRNRMKGEQIPQRAPTTAVPNGGWRLKKEEKAVRLSQ